MANLIKKISLLGILTYGSACHEFEGWNEVYPCNTDISLLIINSRKMMEIYRVDIGQEIKENVPEHLQKVPPSDILDFIKQGKLRIECGEASKSKDAVASWSNWREKVTLNSKVFQHLYDYYYKQNAKYINDDTTFNLEEAEHTMLNNVGGIVGGYEEVKFANRDVHLALKKTVEIIFHEATHAVLYYKSLDNSHRTKNRENDQSYQYGWKASDAINNNPYQEVKEELKLLKDELMENPLPIESFINSPNLLTLWRKKHF